MTADFAEILAQHKRIAIAGGPRVGKTTLAATVTDRRVIATDDYIGTPWADIPHKIIADIGDLDAFALEGVQVARALRKGLRVDAVVYLIRLKVPELTKGQAAMTRGVVRIFGDWMQSKPGVPVYFEDMHGLVRHA